MKEDYTDINAEEGTTPTLTDTDGHRTEPLASQHDANTDAATTDTADTTASADTTERGRRTWRLPAKAWKAKRQERN